MKNDYETRGEITAIFVKYKGKQYESLIDTADLEIVKSFPNTWYGNYNLKTNSLYVRGEIKINGKRVKHYLHRWLFDINGILTVDHYNNNTLDNRRSSNLRILTNAQNQQNKKGARKDSSIGIRGIEFRKNRSKPYYVRIAINQNRISIGSFKDLKQAEKAAKAARKQFMPYSKEAVEV